MGITVLGPLTVDGSGLHSRRDRVVLAVLAAQAGHPVTADQLLDAVWGDSAPASAAKNLQGCMVRLRKLLGNDAIMTSPNGYALTLLPDQIDAARFEQLVDRAREVLLLDEPDRAAYLLGESLSLWQGDPFPDLEAWEPAEAQTHRLRELRLDAEELYAEARLQSGQHREALADCQRLVRAAALRERRWALLARAQYLVGSQGEALRTLHQLRSVLTRQLGIDPSPEVHELEQAILRQDVSLTTGPVMATRGTCPWQGLRSHDLGDAERFFGREDDVAACLEILRESPVLALIGPSGCGKSSLLKAGVASALRARGRRVAVITPGTRPLESLSVLTTAPSDAVLAIDQGEDLFTLCDADERREFLDAVSRESGRRTVLLALRADRLADLAQHPDISRLVERGLYLVRGLDERGLRAAIEGPARQAGLLVEPGLVDLLVLEVSQDPGALPLLSHALLETWKRREGRTLTVAGYRASGGIRGAVAKSAERLYAEVEVEQRVQLRELMLRLVAPGEQGDPVRMKVPRWVVPAGSALDRLLDRLVAARLVTSDAGMLEITHEALIQSWPRLQGWLEDDVEGQRILHHLAASADAWDSMGRPVTELYRGVRLARALDWHEGRHDALTRVEDEFLAASRVEAELEAQSAAQRAREQARLIRRLRLVLTGAVVLLVLALAAGGIAAVQSDRAGDNASAALAAEANAEHAEQSALARSAAARAGATDDVDAALSLGLAAVALEESPETVSSLMNTLAENQSLVQTMALPGADAMSLDVHPDGKTVVVLDTLHRARLIDVATGELLAEHQVGQARNEAVEQRFARFSPDGGVLAVAKTALSRTPVVLLDPETLAPLPRQPRGLPAGVWQVKDLGFSGDGRSLVSVVDLVEERDGAFQVTRTLAYVWRFDSLAHPVRVDLTGQGDYPSAALSHDGRVLYTGWPSVRRHDLRDASVRDLVPEAGTTLAVSPDGRLLAVTHPGGVLLLDGATGRVRHRLALPGEPGSVRFSNDGRLVLAVIWHNRDAAVWDVRTGDQVTALALRQGSSDAVDFDRTSRHLVSAGPDHDLRRWDVGGQDRYLRRIPLRNLPWTPDGGACLAVPSPGAQYVAYSRCDTQAVVLLDVARGRGGPEQPAGDGGFGAWGSWDPSTGRYLAAIDGRLVEYDARSGRIRRTQDPLDGHAWDVSHTPGGSRLVVTDDRRRIRLLDARTLDPVGRPVDFDDVAWAAAGPDDRRAFVVLGGPDRTFFWMDDTTGWAVVDLEAGTVLNQGSVDMGVIWHIAYAPDGRHAAVALMTGQVLILDLETGEPVGDPSLQTVHGGGAGTVVFSPDGTRLASGGFDGSTALWDVETGQLVARIALEREVLTTPAFLPNGEILIVPWGEDAAVYRWDTSPERAVEFACAAAGRGLTETEWRQHLGPAPYVETCPDLASTAR
ncbi:MAG: nSTAND1 domain-containing NTPase [Nocardioides sp.]